MKKFRGILMSMLLVLSLGMLTACGEDANNNADESGTATENTLRTKKEKEDNAEEKREDERKTTRRRMIWLKTETIRRK